MAGIFPADPGFAFPPGTPDVPGVMSGTGAVHMAAATVSFLSMITFCLVQSRRFTGAWAASGRVAAALLAIGLLWGMSGAPVGPLAMFIGVVAAWDWITAALPRLAA